MNQLQPKPDSASYFPFSSMATESKSRVAEIVMHRIAARRLAQARIAATAYGVTTLLGAMLLIPAISYTTSLAEQSGFTSYMSLLISEGTNLAASWKPFVLSVLESAPVVGSILILTAVLVLGYSLMKFLSDLNRIKSYRHAIL